MPLNGDERTGEEIPLNQEDYPPLKEKERIKIPGEEFRKENKDMKDQKCFICDSIPATKKEPLGWKATCADNEEAQTHGRVETRYATSSVVALENWNKMMKKASPDKDIESLTRKVQWLTELRDQKNKKNKELSTRLDEARKVAPQGDMVPKCMYDEVNNALAEKMKELEALEEALERERGESDKFYQKFTQADQCFKDLKRATTRWKGKLKNAEVVGDLEQKIKELKVQVNMYRKTAREAQIISHSLTGLVNKNVEYLGTNLAQIMSRVSKIDAALEE